MNREAWSRYAAGGKWAYDIVEPGFKYNMTDIQAAAGIAAAAKVRPHAGTAETDRGHIQRRICSTCRVSDPRDPQSCHQRPSPVRTATAPSELTIDRDRFIEELTARNIGSSVHFIPIHMHSYYRNRYGWQPNDFPVAHAAFRNMVSLPLSPAMSDQDVADVIEAVLDIRSSFAKRRVAA
jgi:dTDP-4-amino-4,6-dideoxygalactose transaminase